MPYQSNRRRQKSHVTHQLLHGRLSTQLVNIADEGTDEANQVLVTLLIVIVIGPYALLTLGSVLLWRRHHTVATLLIALGCLTSLVSEAANFIIVGRTRGRATAPLPFERPRSLMRRVARTAV